MRLSKEEYEGDTGVAVKRQIGHLKLQAARLKPIFEIKGPMILNARLRGAGRNPTRSGTYAFMGGEKLTLSDVYLSEPSANGGRDVRMLFTPAAAALHMEVQSVILALEEATEAFDGIENWMSSQPEPVAPPPRPKSVRAPRTLEEMPESGAW